MMKAFCPSLPLSRRKTWLRLPPTGFVRPGFGFGCRVCTGDWEGSVQGWGGWERNVSVNTGEGRKGGPPPLGWGEEITLQRGEEKESFGKKERASKRERCIRLGETYP